MFIKAKEQAKWGTDTKDNVNVASLKFNCNPRLLQRRLRPEHAIVSFALQGVYNMSLMPMAEWLLVRKVIN